MAGGARDNKNQEQSPPDIEEVFNNLLKKLGGGNKKAVQIILRLICLHLI